MTRRKPSSMGFTSWIDEQVAEARKRGDFDNLPGKGKPLEGLDKRDPDWWLRSLMEREGLDWLPPTLAIRRDVESFYEALATLPDERAVLLRLKALNKKIRESNSGNLNGPPSTVAPLQAAEVLTHWRRLRR